MDDLKQAAAYAAVESSVKSGMVVGLGTGSTASWVVTRIGELVSSGELQDIRGVPTSERTAELAREGGIEVISLSDADPEIVIDGADEISPSLDLIKGLGGALLREKIVASSGTDGLIVVADDSKLVEALGEGPLPVEVDPFGWEATLRALTSLGCEPTLRMDGAQPFVTDGGHYTIDCLFQTMEDPASLEVEIKSIPGALECGLFVGLAREAFVARDSGSGAEVTRMRAKS